MKALKIIFISFGTIALINFVALLFVTNIHFGHIMLGIAAAVLVVYGIFLGKIPRKIHIVLWAACAVPVFFVVFLMIYGKSNNADYTENAVIVLGAGLNGDEVGSHLALRLDTAVTYLNENRNAVAVVSGGLGAGRNITEAEAMSRYLVAQGISPDRILQEDKSTSTYENLLFSNEILTDYFPGGFRAVVITNDFHVFRAAWQARSLGIDANSIGAPTPRHSFAANYMREMFAVIYFLIFG
ncbi:MAG: YdcF family protein [Defluviitaleaceae bacterium]|nr:YdcF family protein [Defluviitaleaceae bacterium]